MFIMLMDIDSSGVDSLKTYEIPAIINYEIDSTSLQRQLHIAQEIVPDYFELEISDALYRTPWIINGSFITHPFVLVSKGQMNGSYHVLVNNHILNDNLYGNFDLGQLSVQCARKLTRPGEHMYVQGLNILTKINQYDRPFSFVQYATGSYGSDLYTADLSRPLTNDLGFYLSGINWTAHGHRPNNAHKINSFYTNFYWQKMIPGRLDIIYTSKTAGFPGSDQDTLYGTINKDFIDASLCAGIENHKFVLFCNMKDEEYTDLNTSPPFHSTIKNIGIDILNSHDIGGFECDYRFAGALNLLDSDVYGSHKFNTVGLWTGITKTFKRLIISGSSILNLHNTEDFYVMPKFTAGTKIFDSVFVYGSLSRHYRLPLISETHISDSLYAFFHPLIGNPDLQTEYYWSQDLNIRRKNAYITLYKHDYSDRIILHGDSNDQYTVENAGSWQTIGIEGSLEATIYLAQDRNKETATTIMAGYYGNYIFKGDTLPFLPRNNSSIGITFERQTQKFTFGTIFQEQLIGKRQDLSGSDIDASRVFSSIGYIRLLDLYLSFRCDNIFDKEYSLTPGFTAPMRNYSLSVKWNFWD